MRAGIAWLAIVAGPCALDRDDGLLAFVAGDLIKAVAAASVATSVRPGLSGSGTHRRLIRPAFYGARPGS